MALSRSAFHDSKRCKGALLPMVFLVFGIRFQNGAKERSFFPSFRLWIPKTVQRSALCRSRRELSNEYLLAKFGFDTAENEPCKVCPLSVYRSPRFSTYCVECEHKTKKSNCKIVFSNNISCMVQSTENCGSRGISTITNNQ